MLPEHDVLSVTKCIFICCQCLFVAAVIMISCGVFLPTQLFHSVFNFQWPHSCNHIPRTGRDGVALASPLNILILKLNNRGTIASSTILRHLKPFQSFLNYNSTSICITYFKPMSSIRNSCFERVWNYGWILNGCGNVEDFKVLFLIFLELLACTGRFSHLWCAKKPHREWGKPLLLSYPGLCGRWVTHSASEQDLPPNCPVWDCLKNTGYIYVNPTLRKKGLYFNEDFFLGLDWKIFLFPLFWHVTPSKSSLRRFSKITCNFTLFLKSVSSQAPFE